MTYYEPLTHLVSQHEHGWLLKTVLQSSMGISRKLLSRLKRTECGILLNGQRSYISVKVSAGDTIEVRMERETSDDILPQPLPFAILYEDDHLLIINKQAGIIVHPTHGHYMNTLANAVVYHWRQQGVQHRFRPIHRLDQETSGVLAIAKNPYVHQHISEQMKAGLVQKNYLAFVHGNPPLDKGTIDAPIDRHPEQPHVRIVADGGNPAITHYQVERRYRDGARVRLRLETGRTHQIRVHMLYLGFPLIGDPVYNMNRTAAALAKKPVNCARQALHAAMLGFYHPATTNWVEFTAELPDDLNRLEADLNGGSEL